MTPTTAAGPLEALETTYGALPTTATTLTGGGGEHRHFAPLPGLRNSAGKIAPGLDIRGEDGYVLLPPSNHVSGGEYHEDLVAPLYDTPLAAMPAWLVARAQAATARCQGHARVAVNIRQQTGVPPPDTKALDDFPGSPLRRRCQGENPGG